MLINQAPHNLDLWQWICGMPVSLSAECNEGKYHDICVEDEAIIKAHYKNGSTALFVTSTGDYPGTNRLEITGTKGKMVLENKKLTLYMLDVDERDFCLAAPDAKNAVSVSELEDEPYRVHLCILQNFTNAVLHGEALIAPGEEAINELELSNAAYMSAWLGEEISLPVDSTKFEELLAEKISAETKKDTVNTKISASGKYIDRWNTNW